jgi:hypothetical protein
MTGQGESIVKDSSSVGNVSRRPDAAIDLERGKTIRKAFASYVFARRLLVRATQARAVRRIERHSERVRSNGEPADRKARMRTCFTPYHLPVEQHRHDGA